MTILMGVNMKKSKGYIEWRNTIRKEKIKVAKIIFFICLNVVDFCI